MVKLNFTHGIIRFCGSCFKVSAQGGNSQDPAAIGDQGPAVIFSAGMKNKRVLILDLIQAADGKSVLIFAGIAA